MGMYDYDAHGEHWPSFIEAAEKANEMAIKYERIINNLIDHINRISQDQQNNDWQMMGVSIAEAAEYASKLNQEIK